MKRMNLDKKEIAALLGVSQNTWRKKNKAQQEELINSRGYKLNGTFKIAREVFYQVESMGDELQEILSWLKQYGIETRSPKAIINFLIALNMDETKQLTKLAEECNISTSTAYIWLHKLEEQGILKKEDRALKVRYGRNGEREVCTEEQWEEFKKFYDHCIEGKLLPAQIYRAWSDKTGYSYRQVSVIKTNGFFEKFFSILEKALNQLED